ncbi:MAG TPA: hypothetical protein VLT33_35970, partial [Labilithrix sp.]|nr:hypothetical protein [Labilithrix sp.]
MVHGPRIVDNSDRISHIMGKDRMDRDRAIDAIVRFARVVSDTTTRSDVLPLLAGAIERHVGASGVCVVEIGGAGGARIAVARGLPAAAESIVLDPDAMGEELGRAVNEAFGSAFAAVETRPIVASGNLFGAVVMLFRDALADLAAIALDEAAQIEKLERSYA